jgi:hypothetical protein
MMDLSFPPRIKCGINSSGNLITIKVRSGIFLTCVGLPAVGRDTFPTPRLKNYLKDGIKRYII